MVFALIPLFSGLMGKASFEYFCSFFPKDQLVSSSPQTSDLPLESRIIKTK